MCNILHEVENASSICMSSTTLSVMLMVFMNVRIVLCCELRNGIILTLFIMDWHTVSSAKEGNKGATEALFLIIWRFSGHLIQTLEKTHIKNATTILRERQTFLCVQENLVLLTILSSIWLYVHSKSKSKSAGSVALRPNQRAQNRGSRCARIHPHKSQII